MLFRSLANDQNQLVMNLMNKIARKHGFVVLLHEKPFAGVNGSGKHNNWSLGTDTGQCFWLQVRMRKVTFSSSHFS